MKVIRLVASLFLLSGIAYADPNTVNKSSHIAQTQTTGYLAAQFLDKVIIGVASTNGVLEVYNSTFTTTTLISSVSLATVGYRDFNNTKVKGIFWKASNNTNGVTILYKNGGS